MIRSLITAALAALTITPAMAEDTHTIFLVRHAEKQKGPDPALTEEGAARAERLADQLEDAGIEAIYSSDYKRTRETAAPLAARLGLEVVLYDASDLPGIADHLTAEEKSALVVGHSNTTPQLVILLGGESTPIPDTDYDRLYCLQDGETVLLVAGGETVTGTVCPKK